MTSNDDVYIEGIRVIRDPGELYQALQNETEIGFDTETTGLSPWRNSLAVMQFYGKNTGACGVIQLDHGEVPDGIKALFKKGTTFVGHNMVGFDIPFLSTHDVPWNRANWYDTLVGETVVVSTGRRDVSKSLRASARRRLDKTIDKDIEHGHWDAPLSPRQVEYAAEDVLSLHALREAQVERAAETQQQVALDMEQRLMPIVSQMTINGLPVSRKRMEEYSLKLYDQLDQYTYELYEMLGHINLDSHVQIKKAVKERYGIEWKSTAKDALIDVTYDSDKDDVFVAEKLLKYKEPATFLKMHKEEWMDQYIIDDWIHPRFWQCSANTGRFTCSDPNVQQWDRDARFLVGNVPGFKIIKSDLSQIEVRVAAQIANDTALIEALEHGDVHTGMASKLFQLPYDQVTKELRRMAKAATFALLYCGGPKLLYNKARLDGFPIPWSKAQQIYVDFFTQFKGLKALRNKAIAMAENAHANRSIVSIRMPNGLRRILVGYEIKPTVILNNTVQGYAAVLLKQGILNAADAGLTPYMCAQVHDEIVGFAPDKIAEDVRVGFRDAMLAGARKYLSVPVDVEAKVGDTWQ